MPTCKIKGCAQDTYYNSCASCYKHMCNNPDCSNIKFQRSPSSKIGDYCQVHDPNEIECYRVRYICKSVDCEKFKYMNFPLCTSCLDPLLKHIPAHATNDVNNVLTKLVRLSNN